MGADRYDDGSMRTGAAVSGALHAGLLAGMVFGPVFSVASDPVPLTLAEVSIIDGAEFDARHSTAPQAPREVPDAPDPALGGQSEPVETPAEPEPQRTVDEAPPSPEPEAAPEDLPELAAEPTRTPVPTEAARPTIADIPIPDAAPREAEVPESPPATEPLQPLASANVPIPGPRPARPPDPEPEPAEAPEPEPEPAEADTETDIAEEQQEAPVSDAAPQVATLPVARPAELTAASQASRETRRPEPAESASEAEAEPSRVQSETPRAGPAGSSSQFARLMTRGEKDALSLGIKRYFTYNGSRADRQLSVKIEIGLDPSGRIVRGPAQIAVTGGDPRAQQALFQAGRRALLRAQGAGEFARLPIEKYDAWKLIHVTFFPDESIGFQS